jgi:hypothetical protein
MTNQERETAVEILLCAADLDTMILRAASHLGVSDTPSEHIAYQAVDEIDLLAGPLGPIPYPGQACLEAAQLLREGWSPGE